MTHPHPRALEAAARAMIEATSGPFEMLDDTGKEAARFEARAAVTAYIAALQDLTDAERERLKQTAIVGPRSSVVGSGVVLSPTGNVLCRCSQQSDAELIGKLWNAAGGRSGKV
jgi:hypothetical protein